MRPAQKRLDDLQRALDAARSALIEARAIESAGTRETAGKLADAEQTARGLAAELASDAAVDRTLRDTIAEAERRLAFLRKALTQATAERDARAAEAETVGCAVTGLRAKLEAERAALAPLIARRAKEVERLEHRIAMVKAHQEARNAARPAPRPRVVLGFEQAPEVAS